MFRLNLGESRQTDILFTRPSGYGRTPVMARQTLGPYGAFAYRATDLIYLTLNPISGRRQIFCAVRSMRRISRLHLPAACSSNASRDVHDEEYRRPRCGIRRRRGIRSVSRELPLPDPGRLPLERCPTVGHQRRPGAAAGHARDREGQPGDPLRHLRRRPVDEQGPALGCAAS